LGARLEFLPEQLSGGEKQRVAIARALINEPALILADEPTANLDSKIGHDLMGLLRRVTRDQGRSAVIVSHDQRIKDIADRVLWLEDGALTTMNALPVDPVCGMAVERADAPTTAWLGRRLTFCSTGCQTEFLADPTRFIPTITSVAGESG
jgi:putative ABC transport system ATP-binding protein